VTASALLKNLRSRGLRVRLVGNAVAVSPRDQIAAADREVVRAHVPALRAALVSEAQRAAARAAQKTAKAAQMAAQAAANQAARIAEVVATFTAW
jgi:hypothetical protein